MEQWLNLKIVGDGLSGFIPKLPRFHRRDEREKSTP